MEHVSCALCTHVLVHQTGSSVLPNECHMCENDPSSRRVKCPVFLYLFSITGEAMKMLMYALSEWSRGNITTHENSHKVVSSPAITIN